MKRRDFITLVGSAAAAWPLSARAQQPSMPVIGFIRSSSLADSTVLVSAFHNGLRETGFVRARTSRSNITMRTINLIGCPAWWLI